MAAATALLGAACGQPSTDSRADLATYRAAVDRTLSARSFHIDGTISVKVEGQRTSERSRIDYNAPDRIRSIDASGPERQETIAIGRTVYLDGLSDDGSLSMFTVPADRPLPVSAVLLPLRQARGADGVRRTKDGFVSKTGGPGGQALTVVIDAGFVRRVRSVSRGDDATDLVLEFSRFGTAPRVVLPKGRKIVPLETGCPARSPIEFVPCVDDTGTNPPFAVDLPQVDSPLSTLQVRSVLGSKATCGSEESNPPPAESAVLLDGKGACVELGEAGVEVSLVESVAAEGSGDGSVNVELGLSEQDAGRLNGFASGHLGEKAAFVIFGRVISTVTIQSASYDDRIVLPNLSRELAAKVMSALTRSE